MNDIFRIFFLVLIQFLLFGSANCQVGINTDGASPDPSAILDIKSSNKGFLPPRMTQAERDSIVNPVAGLMVYCSDCKQVQVFTGDVWTNLLGRKAAIPKIACGDTLHYEGKKYATVQIGNQCWMADNLNVGELATHDQYWINDITIQKFCYDDLESNCDIYGGTYFWEEVVRYKTRESTKGICPDNWHLPSHNEWGELEIELGMDPNIVDEANTLRGTNQGSQLAGKETMWASGDLKNNPAFGNSGFNAIPSGYTNSNQSFELGSSAYYWSTSVPPPFTSSHNIIVRKIDSSSSQIWLRTMSQGFRFSVRCIQN